MIFSADETADVGIDLATPVVEAIGSEARSRFTGRIPKVTIEVRDASAKADERCGMPRRKSTLRLSDRGGKGNLRHFREQDRDRTMTCYSPVVK